MSRPAPVPQSCNVLSLDAANRRLHHFTVAKGGVSVAGVSEAAPGKPLPPHLVARDWRLLVRSRLDVAWMPPESVFLRVVQLPACAPGELAGMIEFQLEKLSPMPPAQVVWTVETVPYPDAVQQAVQQTAQQTALVTIVARGAVESFVDSLEQGGFMADRLELPVVRRLLSRPVQGDLLRIVLEGPADRRVAVLGWGRAGS